MFSVKYLNHNFIQSDKKDNDPYFWMHCICCNIGIWYDFNHINHIRSMHPTVPSGEFGGFFFGPQLKTHLTCNEVIIKNLLE